VRLQLSEDGADAERLAALTGDLRSELLQLDVEDVKALPPGVPPSGAPVGAGSERVSDLCLGELGKTRTPSFLIRRSMQPVCQYCQYCQYFEIQNRRAASCRYPEWTPQSRTVCPVRKKKSVRGPYPLPGTTACAVRSMPRIRVILPIPGWWPMPPSWLRSPARTGHFIWCQLIGYNQDLRIVRIDASR
jgi:hypothetical protein